MKNFIDLQFIKPDVNRFELGVWDSFDLLCQNKHISVKSTKSFGDLLLLETKDWNQNGEYVPNLEKPDSKYDFTVLVRFSPDGETLMKEHKLLFQKKDQIPTNIKDLLIEDVCNKNWSYDFPGFIYYNELVEMIRDGKIIPQGAMLNGKVEMDAENYYFQTGNMHHISELFVEKIDDDAEHLNVKLKRKCPSCGGELTIRIGYNRFWGCTNFIKGCTYKEKL